MILKNTKVVFMGTPDFAVPILEMLIKETQVLLVVTQPDKEVGRHHELTFSPIKKLALANHIEVFQPIKIREDYKRIIEIEPDLIITCAYGQILPKELLVYPKYKCINVHASLLPKYRGGAPIHRAIMEGEKETGITIMYMAEKMDNGNIITQRSLPILESDNVGILHDKLSLLGTTLLKETLPSILNETNESTPQNEEQVSFAYTIKREEEHLDFHKLGKEVINHIRGLNPWPTANLMIDGVEYKVFEAYFEPKKVSSVSKVVEVSKDAIGISVMDGVVFITKIKPFGKKVMLTSAFVNGIDKKSWIGKEVK